MCVCMNALILFSVSVSLFTMTMHLKLLHLNLQMVQFVSFLIIFKVGSSVSLMLLAAGAEIIKNDYYLIFTNCECV